MKHKIVVVIIALVLTNTLFIISMSDIGAQAVSSGQVLNVGPGQSYYDIQSAINASADGDTVYVHGGVYHERISIDRKISIVGEGSEKVEINGSLSSGREGVIEISSPQVTVKGFTITGDPTFTPFHTTAGIFLKGKSFQEANHCIISENIIINNGGSGIRFYSPSLRDCVIENNVISNNALDGITLYGSRHTISNNTISHNGQDGIVVRHTENNPSTGLNITNNIITDNGKPIGTGVGIFFSYTMSSVIRDNSITHNKNGIIMLDSSSNLIHANTITNNRESIYFNSGSGDNMVTDNSFSKPDIDDKGTGNTIAGNSYGVSEDGDEKDVEGTEGTSTKTKIVTIIIIVIIFIIILAMVVIVRIRKNRKID